MSDALVMWETSPSRKGGQGVTRSSAAEVRSSRSLRAQEVTERIKQYILDNRLRPGDLLPTEGELCTALHASRSSVREAIKTLNALDIVEVRHGHGTYVGRLTLSALVEGLTFRGLLSPGDDFQVLAELVEVRALFERGMADQIVAALDGPSLDALDSAVTDMETRNEQGEDTTAADRSFHLSLVEPVGNDLVWQLSSAFWDVYRVVAPQLEMITIEDERRTIATHRTMAEAARAGDVTAFTRAVDEHYAPVRHRIEQARKTSD